MSKINSVSGEAVLELRKSLRRRIADHRAKRNWLNDHNHRIESMFHAEVVLDLEPMQFEIESALRAAKIPFDYSDPL